MFENVISGAKAERPGLNDVLDFLRRGDTLVVWKRDRLDRSMKHLVETVTGPIRWFVQPITLRENI